jgi:hypothetical protein
MFPNTRLKNLFHGSLEGEELELFQAELNENSDLKAEVALRRKCDFRLVRKIYLTSVINWKCSG